MRALSLAVVSLLLFGLHPSAAPNPDRSWQIGHIQQLVAAAATTQALTATDFTSTMPNGRFWSQLTVDQKRAWVFGYSDGVKTAVAFTYGAEPENKLLVSAILDLQPTGKLSLEEIVQGMDHFYQDTPENAPVVLGAAIRYVGLKADGAKQSELDDFAAGVRKQSATPEKP